MGAVQTPIDGEFIEHVRIIGGCHARGEDTMRIVQSSSDNCGRVVERDREPLSVRVT